MTRPGAQALTPHQDVNAIVALVSQEIQSAIGDTFVGMYLGGSLATGAFNPETSDIGFVVVTEGEITERWGTLIDKALAWRHDTSFDELDDVLRLLRHTIEQTQQDMLPRD